MADDRSHFPQETSKPIRYPCPPERSQIAASQQFVIVPLVSQDAVTTHDCRQSDLRGHDVILAARQLILIVNDQNLHLLFTAMPRRAVLFFSWITKKAQACHFA